MSEDLLSWIFGAAVVQGIFLIVVLATLEVRNANARWLFVAILFVLTLMLSEELLDVVDYQFGVGIGLVSEFLLWPMLYLFVVSLAEDDPRPLRTQWWHLVPTVIAVAWYLTIYLGSEERWISLSNPETRQQIAFTVLIKALYFASYSYMILRRPFELAAKPLASRRALIWVRRWIWFVCGAYLFGLLSFLAFYLEFAWAVDSDHIGGVLMTLGIYSLGYFSIANRNVFDVRRRRGTESQQGKEAADVAARARDYLVSSSAYLDPDLDLKKLADALELSETRLSQYLNQVIKGGFYTLINDLRLDACLALLDDPDNERRTVLELAYEAGFSSKATFYRYFRARQGVTPKAYRARAR